MKSPKLALMLSVLLIFCPLLTSCHWTQDAANVPYTIHLAYPGAQIFEGAGYDYSYSGTITAAGDYTIVEEATDYEDILWGKLQEGGWIDLKQAQAADENPAPLWVCYASAELLSGGKYQGFIAEDSPYLESIALYANENLTDVQFALLGYDGNGNYETAQILYTSAELTPEMPLVSGIVFYGDMTAYGITFTDVKGQTHHYTLSVSGRNGSLVFYEYNTAE